MSIVLQEWHKGCWRSLSIRLLAVLIVVPLACVLIFIPLWLVTSLELSIWFLIIPAGLFLLILFGGAAATIVLVVRRRAQRFDALFAPLGLTGGVYQMFFRQYHGTLEGREVCVYFHRGPTLEIEVTTPLQTRLSVTQRNVDTLALAPVFGREPLSLTDPGLDELTVFSLDEPWARALLAHPEAPDLLRGLVTFEGPFTRRSLLLQPGWLRLHLFGNRNLFRFDISPEQAQQWVGDLLALLTISERLPGPQITAEESSAERFARSVRNRNPYLVPAITVGMVLVMLACAAAAGVAAYLWALTQ